ASRIARTCSVSADPPAARACSAAPTCARTSSSARASGSTRARTARSRSASAASCACPAVRRRCSARPRNWSLLAARASAATARNWSASRRRSSSRAATRVAPTRRSASSSARARATRASASRSRAAARALAAHAPRASPTTRVSDATTISMPAGSHAPPTRLGAPVVRRGAGEEDPRPGLDWTPVALTIGIVGLPNVGKSTLFNALTRAQVLAANYPFATIEPNIGVVPLPDPRLEQLREIFGSERTVPATVSFVDIAGIVKGASEGEGLGGAFLANIREADAICQVTRAFDDPDVVHVDGRVDAASDIETINTELILADLQTLEKVIARLEKEVRNR